MKYFISFGNERFVKSRKRIQEEASKLSIFDEYVIETESIIQEDAYKQVIDNIRTNGYGRGFYWYTWKPYIIYKLLTRINDGDILFYCDSGMAIHNNESTKNRFNNLFDRIQNKDICPTGIVTFYTIGHKHERLEYMYNMTQVFEHFNVSDNKDITHTQQCQAGVSMIMKCEKSMNIVKSWYETSVSNVELFVGDKRFCSLKQQQQMNGFRDHRHDQSIWSVLCKLYNVDILFHNDNPIHQTHRRE